MAGKKAVGCLFLDGINRRLQLDSTDLIFLNALADQVAIALDRTLRGEVDGYTPKPGHKIGLTALGGGYSLGSAILQI